MSIQVSREAQERDEHKRATYQLYIGNNFVPDQLVFVNESGVNRVSLKRSYAWGPVAAPRLFRARQVVRCSA